MDNHLFTHLDHPTPQVSYPTSTGQALPSDLLSFSLPKSKFIQYIDDLLLCSPSLQISQADTSTLLTFLTSQGYRIPSSKVQLSTPQVTYLGLAITPTYKVITLDRKQLIQMLLVPTTKDKILSFLGMADFLHSSILFSLFFPALYMRQPLAPHTSPFLCPLPNPFISFNRPSSRPKPYIFWT